MKLNFANTVFIGLFAAACTGPETEINVLVPVIAAAPATLDFGEVVVEYSETELVQIINAGRAELDVTSITVDDNEGAFTINPTSIVIGVDESVPVEVNFAPGTFIEYAPNLVIQSNDEEEPEVLIPITGEGVDGPVPQIEIDVLSIDFDTVPIGEDDDAYITITNVGDGPLIIEEITQAGSGAFSIEVNPDGQTMAEQGDYSTMVVAYTPTTEDGDSGSITVNSNDPSDPEIEILLLGSGGGDFDYPVAVIDCPTSVDPPTTLDLDGTGSYDPNGYEPLLYEWAVTKSPSSNDVDVDDPEASFTSLDVNLAGTWEVSLSVENSAGVRSAPDTCEFEALPEDALHVELTWDSPNADVDLHLMQSGYEFYEEPGDCCWCNPNPSWGETGSADDPELALDNRTGYGPENIKVYSPVEGEYPVRVHYYSDLGGGTTVATVTIWIDGEEQDVVSTALTHNDKWDVGYVRWPEGVFVEAEETVEGASTRECWEADGK